MGLTKDLVLNDGRGDAGSELATGSVMGSQIIYTYRMHKTNGT